MLAHLNLLKNGQHEDIQGRVPPSHHYTLEARPREVCRPEHTHQRIMFWHNGQRRRLPIKRILFASTVLSQIFPTLGIVGAGHVLSVAGPASVDGAGRTKFASRVASRSTGMKMSRKTRDRTPNAFAARVYTHS
jgi:hypothetical protein